MKTVTIHARYVTSDFDHGDGPGQLFDEDARVGTIRAYRRTLQHIRALSKKNTKLNWRDARSKLRPALQLIARNYWRDFDYDDRKKSAQVKAEAGKLINPLSSLLKALDERPTYVRRGLNSEVTRSALNPFPENQDLYDLALVANQALLQACQVFEARDHRKKGGAIRFQNACRDLVALWEDVFGKQFPRNFKTAPATDRDIARGIKRGFESPGAEFVYIALHEIGNRWVKVSQVEEALKALRGGKLPAR